MSALRRAHSLAWPPRFGSDRLLVPRLSTGGCDGEGGIRTLDERITTRNALAGRRLQPLGHLSRAAQDIGRSGLVPKPGVQGAATLCLPRRGAGAVERG